MKESNFSSEVVLSMIRAACLTRRAELAYQYSQRLENGIVSEKHLLIYFKG
jgi:hypothetical protein